MAEHFALLYRPPSNVVVRCYRNPSSPPNFGQPNHVVGAACKVIAVAFYRHARSSKRFQNGFVVTVVFVEENYKLKIMPLTAGGFPTGLLPRFPLPCGHIPRQVGL